MIEQDWDRAHYPYGRHWVQRKPFGQLCRHRHYNIGHEQVNSKDPAASICRKQMGIGFSSNIERNRKYDFFNHNRFQTK